MHMRNRKTDCGYTLVEVVLSVAILALVSIPLLNYFANSLRSSARMAQKQKATLLTQKVIEEFDAEEKAIKYDINSCTIPFFSENLGLSEYNNALSKEGIGSVEYKGTMDDFDIHVSLSTKDNKVNEKEHTIVSGINEETDVVASESNQSNEAMVYFLAVNEAYASSNGITGLSEEEIRANMSRKMYLYFGWDAFSECYTVKASFTYTCTGLRGGLSKDEYESSLLADVKVAQLENVYLLYARTDHGDLNEFDTLEIKNYIPTEQYKNPELFLICQNAKKDPTYQLRLLGLGAAQNVHSNIGNISDKSFGYVYNNTSAMGNVQQLTKTETSVRMMRIHVAVYKKDHEDGDGALAEMDATKGV